MKTLEHLFVLVASWVEMEGAFFELFDAKRVVELVRPEAIVQLIFPHNIQHLGTHGLVLSGEVVEINVVHNRIVLVIDDEDDLASKHARRV